MTDREHALADLEVGSRRERERVARRISVAQFRWRRDDQGLAELTRVQGECGAGAQYTGRWRDNSGGAYRGVSPTGEEADEDRLAPLEEVL